MCGWFKTGKTLYSHSTITLFRYDQFLDWNPNEYEGINRTILPYEEIWIPDTFLYNSESLEQKRTEALMNGIVETGYWRNDSRGAYVQLMFPAIYKLSCRMNV